MKNLSVVGLVILLSTIFGCGSPKKEEPAPDIISVTKNLLTPTQYDSLCGLKISPSTGEFISSDEAYGKLELYKNFRERTATTAVPYDRKKDVYGFVFGVDRLQELLDKIKEYNAANKKDTLVGVRVYYSRTRNNGEETPDVFLIPVLKNKLNVYPIDDDYNADSLLLTENKLILNTSVPCPNKCNESEKTNKSN